MSTADVLSEVRRAARPHGVTTDDALHLTPRQRQRACRSGVLDRRHAGVYVDPSVPRTALQDLAVAVAAGGRERHLAAAWGRSAAALWGLVPEHPPTPEIVVPRARYARVPGAVVHRSTDLCRNHITFRDHIAVTKPLITAVDLGVVLAPMDLADVLVRARQLKLFDFPAMRSIVAQLARPGRTGIRNARAALELGMIGDRPADSVLELRFHHGPGQHVPPYEYQWSITTRGRKFRIDFAYPSVKLAIEVDGYEKRQSKESLDADDRRSNLLTLEGWTILRFTWTRVLFDAPGVASDILAILGKCGYQFGR